MFIFFPRNRNVVFTIGDGDFLNIWAKCLFIPVLLAMFLMTECSFSPRYTRSPQHKNSYRVRPDSHSLKGSTSTDLSYRKTGLASYYASKFDGRRTASGEIYYNNLFTAAHPTLPFGTNVKVTCLENNRSVVVRINDRGPLHSKKRIIDVSQCAAVELGIIKKGVAMVSVEITE